MTDDSAGSTSAASTINKFFWEYRSQGRSRFNLLLLEAGEYFFEDLSATLYNSIQGRLKICSRSVLFEPNDAKKPIIKYSYKHMVSRIKELGGNIAFEISCSFEMKANNKIGSYKQVGSVRNIGGDTANISSGNIGGSNWGGTGAQDSLLGNLGDISSSSNSNSSSLSKGSAKDTSAKEHLEITRVEFSLLHSDTREIAQKMEKLRSIHCEVEKKGSSTGAAEALLSPFIENGTNFSFDTSQLVDFHERFLLREALPLKRIKPLIQNPGLLMVTERRVYFQPSQVNNVGDTMQCISLDKVAQLYCRRYLLRQTGLEFIMVDGSSTLFAFESRKQRDAVYAILTSSSIRLPSDSTLPSKLHKHVKQGGSSPSVLQNFKSRPTLEIMMRQWQRREISNFEYLMHLNNEADRSVNDLTQYPVFPHVLTDYTSAKLDLEDPAVYRDLSLPMGALNPTRLKYFQKRYRTMPEENAEMGIPPPFLYGTHYSTPGYVLYYLVRVAPEFMLCLQNGKFDATDRMFHSMPETWESSLQNPTDLKELIPEFFCGNGDFLLNMDDLDLGRRHTGERLDNVELPPWAKRPQDFVRKMRKALESEHVSANLHKWIDLVFGHKQKGQAAVEANNLYYYLTYEGSIDLEQEADIRQRAAFEVQIQEFGQTPKQLFADAHPSRNDIDAPLKLVVTQSSLASSTPSGDEMEDGVEGDATSSAASPGAPVKTQDGASRAQRPHPTPVNTSIRSSIQHADNDFDQNVPKQLDDIDGASSPAHGLSVNPEAEEEDSATSPAMRHMSSLFGTIKGKTASFVSSTGWFGSSLLGEGAEGESDGKCENGDVLAYSTATAASSPAAGRLTSSNYKSRLQATGSTGPDVSRGQDLALSTSYGPQVGTAGASVALQRSQGLHPVDATHLHGSQAVTALSLHNSELVLCSVGDDNTLKTARLGSKTLCVASVAETSLPPGTYKRVGFNTTGSSLMALGHGASGHDVEAAFMCTFSVNNASPETPPDLVAAQRVCSSSSASASTVDLACASNDLLDFRARAVGSDTKVSKSFYVMLGTRSGAIYIRSVSHSGVFGSEPAPAFIFQPFGKEERITCISLNGNRVLLAAGSGTGKFSVTNVESRKEAYAHQCGDAISCIAWINNDRVVFATLGGDIVVSDTSSSALASTTFGFKSHTSSFALGVPIISMGLADTTEDAIVCGCNDGSLRVLSLVDGIRELYKVPSAHDGAVTSVLCSAANRGFVVTGGADGFVKIWRIV